MDLLVFLCVVYFIEFVYGALVDLYLECVNLDIVDETNAFGWLLVYSKAGSWVEL